MNKEEIKKIVETLIVDADKIREALEQLELDVQKIQKGDINGPYWSGANACDSIKTMNLQIKYNRDILKELEKNLNYLHSLTQ